MSVCLSVATLWCSSTTHSASSLCYYSDLSSQSSWHKTAAQSPSTLLCTSYQYSSVYTLSSPASYVCTCDSFKFTYLTIIVNNTGNENRTKILTCFVCMKVRLLIALFSFSCSCKLVATSVPLTKSARLFLYLTVYWDSRLYFFCHTKV